MKVVLAPDSFKESLSAPDVCRSLAMGVVSVAGCDPVCVPMADGGEGTGSLLAAALGLERVAQTVRDPLGRSVFAGFFLSADGTTAVVETAEANGLGLLLELERDPEVADSFGCGQLICAAREAATDTVIVTIGGSATVDGGKGMAEALGYGFLDDDGRPLASGAASLRNLATIIAPDNPPTTPKLIVLCDVTNPLLGPRGAAPVFAPQKGADPPMVARLAAGLTRLAERIRTDLGVDVSTLEGGGAAGGMGAGLVAFSGAVLSSGADVVADQVGLEVALKGADLVIAGEGKIDSQSFDGKVLSTVLRLAHKHDVPVCVVAGKVECTESILKLRGVSASYQLMRAGETVEDSMKHVESRLTEAAALACRELIQL